MTETRAEEQKINSKALPDPLTLELALELIDVNHPNIKLVNSDLENAKSELLQAQSNNNLSINLGISARWIEPSVLATNQENEDHRLALTLKKTLYDFGRSRSQENAASLNVDSQNFQYINSRQQQYLKVMKAYFDVVLADLLFYRYNEEMAVAYIRFDRIQIRQKLGQFTDVDVAKKEVEYQRIRRLRTYSQNQQRVTRSLLAQALNRPNDLPSTVSKPEITTIKRKLPDFNALIKSLQNNNPALKALRAKLSAAKSQVTFAQSSQNPTLSASVKSLAYVRETSSSDKWRANLTLNVPLWSGGRVDAVTAKAKSTVYKIEAQLAQLELGLQQKTLELSLGLQTLKVKYDEVLADMNYRELSLDRNRALYELEVQSDLGLSMVEFSAAEREVVQVEFDIALAWAQIDALKGSLLGKKQAVE
ncbi:MAG: TolC family protein [Woeseiaceae bacterium]